MEARIDKVPEGSRLDRFVKDYKIIEESGKDKDGFLDSVRKECETFLKDKLRVTFPPTIFLYLNSKDFKKSYYALGNIGKPPTAFIIQPIVPKKVIIDLEILLSLNRESFVVNLVFCDMEELLHSVYEYSKNDNEIKKLMYPLAEEFLGIPIPEQYESLRNPET